jgi:hypothetical protein
MKHKTVYKILAISIALVIVASGVAVGANATYSADSGTFNFEETITLFPSPDSSFKAISNAIDNANKSIYLNIYQFHNSYLMDHLINAIQRGVEVKVLLEGDPVGGIENDERYIAEQIVNASGEVRFMIDDEANGIHDRYTINHAKYAIIDNRSTILMFGNWKNTDVPANSTYGYRGWGIIINNANVTNYFRDVFFYDWNCANNLPPIVTTVSINSPGTVSEGETFTASVNIDNVTELAIFMFKLSYNSSVLALTKIEKGSNSAISNWSSWTSTIDNNADKAIVSAFSDFHGSPINGSAELARLVFAVVCEAGAESAIDIQGVIGNSDWEPIEASWVDSVITVMPISAQ